MSHRSSMDSLEESSMTREEALAMVTGLGENPLPSASASASAALPPGKRHHYDEDPEEKFADEAVDPRVKGALDALNMATDDINRLEKQVSDAKLYYQGTVLETEKQLKAIAAKMGKSVMKAKPYYDAKTRAKQAQAEAHDAAKVFEKACMDYDYAKKLIKSAEEKVTKGEMSFDAAWQELMNQMTEKVNSAEVIKNKAAKEHHVRTNAAASSMKEVERLSKELKKAVEKSAPYYAARDKVRLCAYLEVMVLWTWRVCRIFARPLVCVSSLPLIFSGAYTRQSDRLRDDSWAKVEKLELDYKFAKRYVADALDNLNAISMEIHDRRLREIKGLAALVQGADGPETLKLPVLEKHSIVAAPTTERRSGDGAAMELNAADCL
eukprot:Opistho-2@57772